MRKNSKIWGLGLKMAVYNAEAEREGTVSKQWLELEGIAERLLNLQRLWRSIG